MRQDTKPSVAHTFVYVCHLLLNEGRMPVIKGFLYAFAISASSVGLRRHRSETKLIRSEVKVLHSLLLAHYSMFENQRKLKLKESDILHSGIRRSMYNFNDVFACSKFQRGNHLQLWVPTTENLCFGDIPPMASNWVNEHIRPK